MRETYKSIVRTAAAVLILAGLTHADLFAGIRLDGTEFQAGSQQTARVATAPQDAQGPTPGTRLVFTLGQAVLAKGQITNPSTGEAVKIGLGYDFNSLNTTQWGCTCPNQGDVNVDGFKDASDLTDVIEALFFNGPNPQDPLCPTFRLDVDCDGFTTAIDLAFIIELIFFGGPSPCLPCAG